MNTQICRAAVLMALIACTTSSGAEGFLPFSPSQNHSFFVISDFLIAYPAGPSDGPDRKLDMSTELGILFSLDENVHLGPAFQFGCWVNGGWHSRWGLIARTRIDISHRMSLDFAPGILIGDSPFPDGFAGYSMGVSLTLDGWLGLSTRLDVTKSDTDDMDEVLRMGVSIGSMPGLCISTVAGATGALVSWLHSMD